MIFPKRLIEVSFPFKEIAAQDRYEDSAPSPAVGRALICAALWPDPAEDNCPQRFRHIAAKLMVDLAEQIRDGAPLVTSQDRRQRWEQISETTFENLTQPAARLALRDSLVDFVADFANSEAVEQPIFCETARFLTEVAHESLGGLPNSHPVVSASLVESRGLSLEALRIGAKLFATDLGSVIGDLNEAETKVQQLAEEPAHSANTYLLSLPDDSIQAFVMAFPEHASGASEEPSNEIDDAQKGLGIALSQGRRACVPPGIGLLVFDRTPMAVWERLLPTLIETGWIITTTWPVASNGSDCPPPGDDASPASAVYLVCRPREHLDGSVRTSDVGYWPDVIKESTERLRHYLPQLLDSDVTGLNAALICIGPALECFSRYTRVEKADGSQVPVEEYLDSVWSVIARLLLDFTGATIENAALDDLDAESRFKMLWRWMSCAGVGKSPPSGSDVERNSDCLGADIARRIEKGLEALDPVGG